MPVTDGGTECTRHTSRTGAVSFDRNYQLDTNVLEKEKGMGPSRSELFAMFLRSLEVVIYCNAPHPSQEMQVYRRECSGRIDQQQQVAQTIPKK